MIHMVITNVSSYFPVFPQRIEGTGGHTHPHDINDFPEGVPTHPHDPDDPPIVPPERLDSVVHE